MKQSRMTRVLKRGAFAHAIVVGCVAVLGCSSGSQDVDAPASAEGEGSIRAELQIDPGVILNTITYSVTGPAAFTKTGAIDVHASDTLTAIVSPIPAGTGFDIVFNGTATDGSTTCAGSTPFDIAAGQTTLTTVDLACHEAARSGSVQLNGSLNVCPSVESVAANPTTVATGGTSQLTGTAHDLDLGPSPLAYHWTTDLGTLSDPAALNPTLTCTAPGAAHVTLSVTDGDPTPSCTDSRNTTIVCGP